METTHRAMVIGNGDVPCRGANDETDIESYHMQGGLGVMMSREINTKTISITQGKNGPSWLLVVELEEQGQLRERKWQKSLEEAGRTQGI